MLLFYWNNAKKHTTIANNATPSTNAPIINIEEARKKAVSEAHLQIEEATRRIREEKEKAIREVRSEIADLSIAIAEIVMKEKIGRDKEQQQMIDRLLDEVSFSKS